MPSTSLFPRGSAICEYGVCNTITSEDSITLTDPIKICKPDQILPASSMSACVAALLGTPAL